MTPGCTGAACGCLLSMISGEGVAKALRGDGLACTTADSHLGPL